MLVNSSSDMNEVNTDGSTLFHPHHSHGQLIYDTISYQRSSQSYYDREHYYTDTTRYNTSGTDDPNSVLRLVFLSFVSTAGTLGGIFVISAITVRGNCYLVSLAFGHLLITITVLPASVVAIMAGVPNDASICHFQWLATMFCLIVSVLSFMFMAMDNFFGLGSIVTYELCCTKCRIVTCLLIIWTLAIAFPIGQHLNNFGPEFCESRRHQKIWIDFHPYIFGFVIIVPTLITIWYFTRSLFKLKNYKLQLESMSSDPTAAFILTDGFLLQSNVLVYIATLLMWMPLVVVMVIDCFEPVKQEVVDTAWCIVLSNSCGYSYLYALTNRDFREAFNKLFYYCCCKSHVTFARKGIRGGLRPLSADPMGLRVHIIPGLNIGRSGGADVRSAVGSTGSGGHHGFLAGGAFAKTFHSKSCEL